MTHRLVLVRHAQSAHSHPRGDHARVLTERGMADAVELGRWLARQGLGPAHVLASTAQRAAQTLAALRDGQIAGAALDVVDPEPLPENHPLWGTPNTLLTPHIGGDTTAFEPRIVQMLTEQVRRINDGQQPLNVVS